MIGEELGFSLGAELGDMPGLDLIDDGRKKQIEFDALVTKQVPACNKTY